MHESSMDTMKSFIEYYLDRDKPLKVLDVGSCDFGSNYSYRQFINSENWTYEGLDLCPGANVDIVSYDPYKWPIENEFYDVVISGQCLEHTQAPWMWIKEIERVCKVGGLTIIVAPWNWDVHLAPLDCWRILPDGMKYLLEQYCSFIVLNSGINEHDCWGVGIKTQPIFKLTLK